jgi:hypothetical protein
LQTSSYRDISVKAVVRFKGFEHGLHERKRNRASLRDLFCALSWVRSRSRPSSKNGWTDCRCRSRRKTVGLATTTGSPSGKWNSASPRSSIVRWPVASSSGKSFAVNPDLGRPDRIQLIFPQKITSTTPVSFRTRVLREGAIQHPNTPILQYSSTPGRFEVEDFAKHI